jgi:hypothetical protein
MGNKSSISRLAERTFFLCQTFVCWCWLLTGGEAPSSHPRPKAQGRCFRSFPSARSAKCARFQLPCREELEFSSAFSLCFMLNLVHMSQTCAFLSIFLLVLRWVGCCSFWNSFSVSLHGEMASWVLTSFSVSAVRVFLWFAFKWNVFPLIRLIYSIILWAN